MRNSRNLPPRAIMSFVFDMRILLHVLTKPADELTAKIIAAQKSKPENQVEIVDLAHGDPDYKMLLEKIFAADSVHVW